jgi:cysteine desulfurase
MKIYLDNAATTKIFPEIKKEMLEIFDKYYANPNAVYSDAQKSRNLIEESRRFLADIIGCKDEEIIFTSCATESNNTIIRGLSEKFPEKNEIIISPIEHKSVLNPVKFLQKKGFNVKFLKIDKNGLIDIDDLKSKISSKTLFVSVIHGNNETGVLQDIQEIGKICKKNECYFFSDVVQSFCKEKLNLEYLDFFSVSGHKINAPKGVGLFYKKDDIPIVPLLFGGGQEKGLRSGTENVAFIKFLSDAVKIWNENNEEKVLFLKKLRDKFESLLRNEIPEIEIVSEDVNRLPNISAVIFPKVDAQSMVIGLDSEGLMVSSGSACSSGTPTPSHVLLAYGYSEKEALRYVRFSFGLMNSEEEIFESVKKVKSVFDKMYNFF